MTETTDTDDAEEVQETIEYIAEPLGLSEVARGLAGYPSNISIEELPDGDARETLRGKLDVGEEAISAATLDSLVTACDHGWAVRSTALDMATRRVTANVEQGVDRPQAVGVVVRGLPDRVAQDLVQSELDMAESRGYSSPHDFEDDLALLRLEADLYGPERNRDERLKVWDEMLKYTLYKSEIRYSPHGEERVLTDRQERWEVSSAKCHNNHLRDVKRAEVLDDDSPNAWQFEGSEQVPVKRFFPEFDPLPDVQDFVLFPGEDN